MTLLRCLTFLLGSQTVILIALLFSIYFFLLMLVFVLQWLSLYWEIPSNSQWDAPFHYITYDYSHTDWDGLCDHFRDIPWEDILKLGASAAASKFFVWGQVGIDVYIPHRKHQVKLHSSPCFSAACVAAIFQGNHIFRLYQKEKTSDYKVKFRQARNHCKRVLEASKLAYANKTKESTTSQKLALMTFGELLIVF